MQKTTIIQPTAEEMLRLLTLATGDNNIEVKFQCIVTNKSEEIDSNEVCEILSIGKTKLHSLINSKILNPVLRGRKNIFSRSKVMEVKQMGII